MIHYNANVTNSLIFFREIADNTVANSRRIALVESCFGSAGQPLSVPGRVLVGQGVLQKSCRKRLKPRRFFLFNDILVYGNIIIDQKKYNKQRVIPLEEVKLKVLDDDGEHKNGWLICARSNSFAVYAATPWERREWMHHTDKCIRDRLASGGKQPPSDLAAVWVPDNEAPVCMACKKNKFSAINRRVNDSSLSLPGQIFNCVDFFCITSSTIVANAGPSFAERVLPRRFCCLLSLPSPCGFATDATMR